MNNINQVKGLVHFGKPSPDFYEFDEEIAGPTAAGRPGRKNKKKERVRPSI